MNAEFNWWLLIVGVVGGAGLLWLVLGDWSRREEEIDAEERSRESAWIAEVMDGDGQALDAATAEEVLRLHRVYLRQSRRLDPLEVEELQALAEEREAEEPPAEAERTFTFEGPVSRKPLVED